MIPKIIHYCWLSKDPIPEDLQGYLDIWKEKLNEYEFILWNFDRFDKNSSLWVKQSFDCKKYAFAADYIRLHAIYNYGGIYLDLDVEVLKTLNPFLDLKTMIGFETEGHGLEVAAFGAEKNATWVKQCLSYYENRLFIKDSGEYDTRVLPLVINDILVGNRYKLVPVLSLKEAIQIEDSLSIPVFSCDYFSPKSHSTGKIAVTSDTVCVHHFAGTWLPFLARVEQNISRFLGVKNRYLFANFTKKMRW